MLGDTITAPPFCGPRSIVYDYTPLPQSSLTRWLNLTLNLFRLSP